MRSTTIRRVTAALSAAAAAVVIAVAGPGTPSASAAAYHCGETCTGHSTTWVIPSNGIRCSRSAKLIASRTQLVDNQASKRVVDSSFTSKLYYSTVCQTMWVTMTRHGNPPYPLARCIYGGNRTDLTGKTWTIEKCPGQGKTLTSPTINDYNSKHAVAAEIDIFEDLKHQDNGVSEVHPGTEYRY